MFRATCECGTCKRCKGRLRMRAWRKRRRGNVDSKADLLRQLEAMREYRVRESADIMIRALGPQDIGCSLEAGRYRIKGSK